MRLSVLAYADLSEKHSPPSFSHTNSPPNSQLVKEEGFHYIGFRGPVFASSTVRKRLATKNISQKSWISTELRNLG
jgi:hypothetical protein